MIQTNISVHISPEDLKHSTFILNDRTVGALGSVKQQNYLMSGSRSVQMLIQIEDSVYQNSSEAKHLISLWENAFRLMQVKGSNEFFQLVEESGLKASKIVIFDDAFAVAWINREQGVYVQRNERIYRLQPCLRPKGEKIADQFRALDFYMFNVRNQDAVFILPPDFINVFDPEVFENNLNGHKATAEKMNELIKTAKKYQYEFYDSWFAIQILRVEKNTVWQNQSQRTAYYHYRNNPNFVESNRKQISQEAMEQPFYFSQFMPIRERNILIDPRHKMIRDETLERKKERQEVFQRVSSLEGQRDLEGYNIPSLKQEKAETAENSVEKASLLGMRTENLFEREMKRRYEKEMQNKEENKSETKQVIPKKKKEAEFKAQKSDIFMGDLSVVKNEVDKDHDNREKNYSNYDVVKIIKHLSKQQKIALVIGFFFVMIIIFGLFNRGKATTGKKNLSLEENNIFLGDEFSKEQAEIVGEDGFKIIRHLIRVNSLNVRVSPSSESDLIAVVKEGDIIIQIAAEKERWMKVRLKTGEEGYVATEYLKVEE